MGMNTDSLFRARKVNTPQAWENVVRERDAEIARLRLTIASAEEIANDTRDDWVEARHTDDGDQYGLATDEALKWERIGCFLRSALK